MKPAGRWRNSWPYRRTVATAMPMMKATHFVKLRADLFAAARGKRAVLVETTSGRHGARVRRAAPRKDWKPASAWGLIPPASMEAVMGQELHCRF